MRQTRHSWASHSQTSCSQLQLQKDQGRRRGRLCGRHGACWGCLWSPCPIREELRPPGHHSSSALLGSCGLSGPGCPQPPCQAVRDALDKVWGWWHGEGQEVDGGRGRSVLLRAASAPSCSSLLHSQPSPIHLAGLKPNYGAREGVVQRQRCPLASGMEMER